MNLNINNRAWFAAPLLLIATITFAQNLSPQLPMQGILTDQQEIGSKQPKRPHWYFAFTLLQSGGLRCGKKSNRTVPCSKDILAS